ncbi:MAG TPA: ubiquinol-cytochrome c reductase iron-sulfur subunit [Acidimicrobiales bacterium]|nr:ubiquinol-cytochrome c reductase iron-sulfur subunit [Acidimicrobiales bacterium]
MSDLAAADARSRERRDVRLISASFWVSALAAVGLAATYWRGGQPQVEGALIATSAAAFAVGMITWSHRLLPQGPFEEAREPMPTPAADRARFEADLAQGGALTSRRVVLVSLGASVIAIVAAFLFPVRSLGPAPTGAELDDTPWARGKRVVTSDGSPVAAGSVPLNSLVSVFPEGATDSQLGQAVLMRVDPGLVQPGAGRADWAPEGLIAYSKLCTHAGCPVGLFEAYSYQLLCPCHQSTFDVLRSARPIFGPAAVALPQLPLYIDGDGNLRAGGGFSSPPGPSYWNRSQ